MAKEQEVQTLKEYGKRKRRIRRGRIIILSILLLAVGALGIAYILHLINRSYQSYEAINTMDNSSENASGYLKYKSSVVKYTKNGATAMKGDGSILWNVSYEMNDPIADTCGDYVAIADRGKKQIQLIAKEGSAGSIETLNDIQKIEVSKQGVVAALMEGSEYHYIKLYSLDSTIITKSSEDHVLAENLFDIRNEVYPIDIALSEDGKKLAVSFLSVASGKPESTIGFYNYGEVGQNYSDRLVGGFEYKDIIIPRVSFINKDTAIAYKENGFMIYSCREFPSLLYEETFEKSIKSIIYSENNLGVVLEGEGEAPDQLVLYDLTGKKVLEKELSLQYDKIYLFSDEIIMYNNLTCLILKTNGSVKFSHTFESDIDEIFPINNLDKYFLINAAEISEIVLHE